MKVSRGSHGGLTKKRASSPSGQAYERLNEQVGLRLAGLDQRYTASRMVLVQTLAGAGRPLSIPEILEAAPDLPQSSAYRTVTVLMEAGVVRRLSGTDGHGRFELTEDLSDHHHHVLCAECGQVADIEASPRLERAMAEAARLASAESGFSVNEHRFDLVGTCPACS